MFRAAMVVAVCALPLSGCGSVLVAHAEDDLPVGEKGVLLVGTHCGFELAQIDGVTWRTRLRDDGQGNPPRGWPQAVTGIVERVSEDRAVFTGSNPEVRAVFHRAPDAHDLCR